ncbi:MAG: hypothetical protein BAJALOKI1v1_1060012 [Promethearchaeota archaeon]|nr:MAG: hypothetical protein BAJALOKI1v1_1060012 [Candidatus Lokiarchaeota archaeon]
MISNYSERCVNMNELIESVKISFICPKCKSTKKLEFPRSVVDKANNLTTISIPKFLICDHAFQAFVDKNFKIRGYQSVDFEFKNTSKSLPSPDGDNKQRDREGKDNLLFEKLITEGNFVEYIPKDYKYPQKTKNNDKQLSYNRDKEESSEHNPTSHSKPGKSSSSEEAQEKNSIPKEIDKNNGKHSHSKEKSLKEIYEDFWEFIPDENEVFREFIIKDERRKYLL